ncbi:hypothetical protein VNO80_22434 [Phaseolus coccineus]|uniref:Uncharacterized protein n=1 Tax=Phaseolus coccineus TaxID=3886 RepID=A0AAN9M9V3_PHACN
MVCLVSSNDDRSVIVLFVNRCADWKLLDFAYGDGMGWDGHSDSWIPLSYSYHWRHWCCFPFQKGPSNGPY